MQIYLVEVITNNEVVKSQTFQLYSEALNYFYDKCKESGLKTTNWHQNTLGIIAESKTSLIALKSITL